ncbi:MAG: molybdenum cofactor biosynthesis protein MoaE [Rhodospirillales bacterium]|jgi:molybdopterin synthase catalytic subunit|nr:molybdenum cofactor biosynthesis protein MoaE [Rhodospirillales bacterium]
MIRLQREDFDPGIELARLGNDDGTIGGVCAFVGLVRSRSKAGPIEAMTLEHYPGMTEKALARIETEARARWPLDDVVIIHRHGRLKVGERIVLVAAASAHREAAFDACRFLIDWLKTEAPFWKREEGPAGPHWVDARTEDDEAARRWRDEDREE